MTPEPIAYLKASILIANPSKSKQSNQSPTLTTILLGLLSF